MANSLKKRGQKLARKFSRASIRASENSRKHIIENIFHRLPNIRGIRLLILEWSLLVAALIMLAVAQAFWFSDSYAENTFVPGGTYIEATLGRVNSLNPLFAMTESEKTLSRLMFATLVANDRSGHPGPGLAESLQASEDGKVWTMRLRDNLQWSDGEPLTIDDVMFTLGLVQNPAVNSIYDSNLENVKITKKSENEVVFTLAAPYADFASALIIPVVPQHILGGKDLKTLVEDDFSVAPVTSGPFAFNATQATSTSDEEIVYLSANQYYYGGAPMLASFGVHTYPDKASLTSGMSTGSVTATAALAGEETEQVVGNFAEESANVNAGAFIFFNTGSGAFREASLRRAVRKGLDMEALRATAPGTQALDYPILASQINLASYPALPEHDLVAATDAINAARGDGQIHVNIATVNSGYLPAVAENLKEQLGALGLDADLTVYEETQEFLVNVVSPRAYDILIYEMQLGADPDLLPYYHSSQASSAGLNLSGYRNTIVDDLLVGARETLDTELCAKKYESFLETWASDAPAIGIYQVNMTYLYNKNVRPFDSEMVLVTAMDRFIDIYEWAAAKGTRSLTP